MPSLFETRRRLPTSATAYDVRATKPRLSVPRRDDGLDHLPFLTHHAAPCEAVMRGEPRCVHPDDPSAGSSRLRELAQP